MQSQKEMVIPRAGRKGKLRKVFGRLALIGAWTIAFVLAAPGSALAHARLVRTTPKLDGKDRTHLSIAVDALPPGEYVVEWSVLSLDGHTARVGTGAWLGGRDEAGHGGGGALCRVGRFGGSGGDRAQFAGGGGGNAEPDGIRRGDAERLFSGDAPGNSVSGSAVHGAASSVSRTETDGCAFGSERKCIANRKAANCAPLWCQSILPARLSRLRGSRVVRPARWGVVLFE